VLVLDCLSHRGHHEPVLRHPLTPEEQAERDNDPNPLTRQAYRHPWRLGVLSGLLIASWIVLLDLPWQVGVAVGMLVVIVTGLAWRPGGHGQRVRRYMLRRFPKNP